MRYPLPRFRLRSLFLFLIVVACACGGLSIFLRNRDARALAGTWEVLYVEEDGSRFVPKGLGNVDFDGSVATVSLFGERAQYRVTLDGLSNPGRIDCRLLNLYDTSSTSSLADYRELETTGIYRISRDRIELCFGEHRPPAFASKAESNQSIVVLRRLPERLNGP